MKTLNWKTETDKFIAKEIHKPAECACEFNCPLHDIQEEARVLLTEIMMSDYIPDIHSQFKQRMSDVIHALTKVA